MKTHSCGCSIPHSNNLSIYLSIYGITSLYNRAVTIVTDDILHGINLYNPTVHNTTAPSMSSSSLTTFAISPRTNVHVWISEV